MTPAGGDGRNKGGHDLAAKGMTMANIGYLGGGNMAQAMTRRLLAAGHAVTIYNRTPDKLRPLTELGAVIAATPRDAAIGADIVFSSVTDDAASRFVWSGPDGALSADLPARTLIVEHSTMTRDWVLELSQLVAERGLRYLDCPVAGRPDAAAAGQLIVFAGAEKSDLDEITPLIQSISKEIFHFGPPGSGTAFKLIYNLMGVVQIVALAEGLVAAEAAGIDLHVAARAFANGNTGSGHVIKHGPFMAAGNHEDPPGFTPRGRLKDSTYGVELEERLGQQPSVGRAAMMTFERMVDAGMADCADSMLFEFLRSRCEP